MENEPTVFMRDNVVVTWNSPLNMPQTLDEIHFDT